MEILVTGGAGFIGSNTVEALLARGERVIALDNFNDYYSPDRKHRNVAPFVKNPNFRLVHADLRQRSGEDMAVRVCAEPMGRLMTTPPGRMP